MALSVDSTRTDPDEGEKEAQKLPAGYDPTPIDYLRRCSNDEEALEVIKYLEERGEVDGKLSEELREQVRSLGVRSFGPLKEEGYYLRKYGCRSIR